MHAISKKETAEIYDTLFWTLGRFLSRLVMKLRWLECDSNERFCFLIPLMFFYIRMGMVLKLHTVETIYHLILMFAIGRSPNDSGPVNLKLNIARFLFEKVDESAAIPAPEELYYQRELIFRPCGRRRSCDSGDANV